jgi:hypothetical protein
MEQHIRVLRDAARKYRSGKLPEDQVYVWWGKLRSEHRSGPLPHLDQILALDVEPCRDDPSEETHVYLTDFASLYVAHLGEVRRQPPEAREDGRVPGFNRRYELAGRGAFEARRDVGWSIRSKAVESHLLAHFSFVQRTSDL